MVKGLDIFRAWFANFADQYMLIVGTAASLTMDNAGLAFRTTKDLDIVLHMEAGASVRAFEALYEMS
jgi:hypothetical protein